MNKKLYTILCGIFFIIFLLLLAYRIEGPWRNLHDDNGAWYSACARTHIIKGLSKTRGQDFFLSKADGKMEPYLHHPPLLGLYLAGVFYLSGHDSPIVARSAVAFFHMLSFIVFLFILKIIFSKNYLARAWAVFVFSVVPMSVYFGKMPDHEPLSLFFLLTGIYCYLCYVRTEKTGSFWLLFAGAISWALAMFSSWHAIFVIAGVTIHAAFFFRKGTSRFVVMSLICMVAVPLLVAMQILWANNWQFLPGQKEHLIGFITGNYGDSVFMPKEGDRPYFWRLLIVCSFTFKYFGGVPGIFAAFWLCGLFFSRLKKQAIPRMHLFVAALPVGTVFFSLVFSSAMMFCRYLQFYLLPFIATASALYVTDVYERKAFNYKHGAVYFIISSMLLTGMISLGVLYIDYSEIGLYAVQVATRIQQNYF